MNSLKLIIPLVIVSILLGAGVYTVYKNQTGSSVGPKIQQDFFPSASASATPAVQGATTTPQNQPATGQDELEIKNVGIQLATPTANQRISSPTRTTGTANVTSQTVVIKVIDSNGNTLGQGVASACLGLDACPFEATIAFQKPTTKTGFVEAYSPSTVDASKTFSQTIPVTF